MRSKANLNVVSLKDGVDGATFTPNITADGYLTWTNNKNLPNPSPFKLNEGSQGVDETVYTVPESDFISSGKIVLQREGVVVIVNGSITLKKPFVAGTDILQLDPKYTPASIKNIGFINTSGFCYVSIDSNGMMSFLGGDKGTANESYEIDGRYNILL